MYDTILAIANPCILFWISAIVSILMLAPRTFRKSLGSCRESRDLASFPWRLVLSVFVAFCEGFCGAAELGWFDPERCWFLCWSGWWFGPFFIFPYIGKNHPNWLIFFRGVAIPPIYGDVHVIDHDFPKKKWNAWGFRREIWPTNLLFCTIQNRKSRLRKKKHMDQNWGTTQGEGFYLVTIFHDKFVSKFTKKCIYDFICINIASIINVHT